jgi:hypothetical protein
MSTNNQMLQFFQTLRLPLYRNKTENISIDEIIHVHKFLERRFNIFLKDLNEIINAEKDDADLVKQIREELSKRAEDTKKLSQAIIDSLIAYRNGEVLEAYHIFEDKMDEVKDEIASCDIRAINTQLFRIRLGKFGERKDLFHIPFEEITKVKAYRYSIAGFPCLYMSGNIGGPQDKEMGLPLAWLETDTPSKFSWSEFKFADTVESMKLVDLTVSPFSTAFGRLGFYNRIIRNDITVKDEIVRFVVTYPLIAACSLVVMDKGKVFSPEYIIPQMLLLWVHNKSNQNGYRGIKYFSCTRYEEARRYSAFNVVIPAQKNSPLNGYCPKLKEEFELIEPKFIDVQEIFKSLSSRYEEVLLYRNDLEQKYKTGKFAIPTMEEMLSLCNSFINLYEKVCNGEIENMSWVLEYIETLNLFSSRMKEHKYYCLMLEEVKTFDSYNFEKNKNLCKEIWEGFKSVDEFVSHFRNFGFTYFYQETDLFQSIE